MTQGLLEILGIYLRLQTIVPQTHQLLCQQSYLNGQVHEAFRKLVMRYQSPSKAIALQMLYPPDSSLQLSTMVLQQGPAILPYENPQQNVEKSYHLDFGGLQNFALRRY